MKKIKYLTLCLVIFSVSIINAQTSSNEILPEDILIVKHPSAYALNEIRQIQSFDSVFNLSASQYYGENGNFEGFNYDFTGYLNFLKKLILSDDEPVVRQYAALQIPVIYLEGCKFEESDSTLKNVCLQLLKPDDIIWEINIDNSILFWENCYTNSALKNYLAAKSLTYSELDEEGLKVYKDLMVEKSLEYAKTLYEKNPVRIVRANALRNILDLLYLFHRDKEGEIYYNILKNDFSDIQSETITRALIEYNPDTRTKVGKSVPEFKFRLINSEDSISSESLKGRYYLLSFWATWCAPCVSELPELNRIYEKLKSSNFTIVSISLDDTVTTLEKFRDEKGTMPWYNTILQNGFNNDLAKYFGVTYIPQLFLIGPGGSILANSLSLRGKNLEEEIITLVKTGKSPSPQ